jgi:hypothetical protein
MSNGVAGMIASALDDVPVALKQAVINEFRKGYQKEMVKAEINHQKIAQTNKVVKRNSIEGIGRLRMSIDPTLYHHWGQKYGYDCWRDNQFLREVERDNPEVKVNCGGTKLQFGFQGENKRYSKKYDL